MYSTMDHDRVHARYHDKDEIFYLGLTKCVVFVIVATFVLYLPLGDPHSLASTNKNIALGAVCCLCDIHEMVVKAYHRMSEVIQYIITVIKDALYDAKLRVYGSLAKIDRKDLCRNACAQEWEEDVVDTMDNSLRRRQKLVCRCVKKKCCRTP